MNTRIKILTITLAGVFLFTECGRDPFGNGIRFVAHSTGYASRLAPTRTSYSEVFSEDGNDLYERIDWVNGDRILLYCERANNPMTGQPYGEYTVISHTEQASRAYSSASIAPSQGNALQWGEGQHIFYGMYPSPGNPDDQDPENGPSFLNGTMRFRIPTEQAPARVGNSMVLAPDMTLAPLLCRTGPVESGAREVELEFTPQYTAYQFTIGKGGNDQVTVKEFTLSAKTGLLAGWFVVPEDGYNDPEAVATEDGSDRISIDWRESPIILDAEHPDFTFTVLALPTATSGLTLSITSESVLEGNRQREATRFVTLQNNEGIDLGFAPYKKYRIRGLEFPVALDALTDDPILWDYSLSILDNVIWWISAGMEGTHWFDGLDYSALAVLPDRADWWSDGSVIDVFEWLDDRLRQMQATPPEDTAWWMDSDVEEGVSDDVDYGSSDDAGEGGSATLPDDTGWWVDGNVGDGIGFEQFGAVFFDESDVYLWRNQRYTRTPRCTVKDSGEAFFDYSVRWSCTPARSVILLNESTGEITAHGPGTATVTATVIPNRGGTPVSVSYHVTVSSVVSLQISPTSTILPAGQSLLLGVDCGIDHPAPIPDDFLLWTSSAPCLTLSHASTGLSQPVTATGQSEGNATVRVQVNPLYQDGISYSLEISVNVKEE